MPDEIIIDDEIKSDSYSVSINSIILLYKPRTIPILSKLLDENGYFGRYKILRKLTKKIGNTIINIEVYLPNSNFYYVWPFKTSYNMTDGVLLRKVSLKNISSTNLYVFMLAMAHGAWGQPKIELNTLEDIPNQFYCKLGNDIEKLKYIIKIMAQAGLFGIDSNNKLYFRLKHDPNIYTDHLKNNDFIEVISNLLDSSLWIY
jgi:hypothetical protein